MRRRSSALLGGIAVVALVATGCSSSGTTAESSSTAAPEQGSAPASESASAGAGDNADPAAACVAEASAAVEAAKAEIAPNIPADAIDVSSLKGKTIWFLSATQQLPVMVSFSEGVKKAAAAAGLEVKIFDGESKPAKFNEGLTQAVDQGADGIVLQGIDPELVKAPLADALAAGIPIVDAMNGDPDAPLLDGISAHVTVDFTESGKLMADYILSTTNCQADVLELTNSLYVALKNKSAGFNDEITRLCPDCTVDTQEVDFATIATGVDSIIRSGLQKNPDINFVMGADDSIAFFAEASLEALGSDVPMVSGNGVPVNMAFVADGKNQVMDVSFPPNESAGWQEVDLLMRAMLGKEVPSGAVPQQIVDKDNIAADPASQFPLFADYEGSYQTLWGVS